MKLLTLNFLTCARKQCRNSTNNTIPGATTTTMIDPASGLPTTTAESTGTTTTITTTTSSSPPPLHLKSLPDLPLLITKVPQPFNPTLIVNILPRLDWNMLRITASEAGITLPDFNPAAASTSITASADGEGLIENEKENENEAEVITPQSAEEVGGDEGLKLLHVALLETTVETGALCCERCGWEYKVMEGIANFLLPAHLV
ncbi:MAG: hypothetical protein M1825_000307 [Sarcosagium campestre]|nr:MAG: hypothetical protein M1825_000307 [Sarcosagium campestre]